MKGEEEEEEEEWFFTLFLLLRFPSPPFSVSPPLSGSERGRRRRRTAFSLLLSYCLRKVAFSLFSFHPSSRFEVSKLSRAFLGHRASARDRIEETSDSFPRKKETSDLSLSLPA